MPVFQNMMTSGIAAPPDMPKFGDGSKTRSRERLQSMEEQSIDPYADKQARQVNAAQKASPGKIIRSHTRIE